MTRWKSPQAAAKHAERTAKEAEQHRKEKRRSWLLVIGVALASIGLMVGDYFWLRHRARQRHEMRHKQPAQTNRSGVTTPGERSAPNTNE